MESVLTNEEIRVLSCLIEKEMATPDYYPLSMNALINACNQKSNRNPVVAWNEETVFEAIEKLKEKQLVWQSNLSRVPKYEERFVKDNNLIPKETSILSILMLRGPQTAGEIRGRTERLYSFENLEEVNSTLEHLISLKYVVRMSRQPGRKEVRYYHTMSKDPEELCDADTNINVNNNFEQPAVQTTADSDRIAALEEKVALLSTELEELKQFFTDFKQQFE